MRLLLALAVVALALVAWLAFTPRRAVMRDVRTETAHDSTNSAHQPTTLDVASEAEAPRRAPEGTTTRTTAKATSEVCRLRGRVVDEFGVPISGAQVLLREWATFPEVVAKHETTTGHGGGFELVFPVPASAKQSLTCSAEPFHVPVERWYGLPGVGEVQRLVAGDVDAADYVLAGCGVVEGRVITPDTMPVQGVWVRLLCDGRNPTGASTDASGRYSVANVLPGRWVATITDDDWTVPPKTVVDVEFNRVTPVADIVVERTATIEGIVVEADGTPVPYISVTAGRAPNEASAWDTSLPDGTFTLKLSDSRPMLLSVGAQRDFMEFACAPGDTICTFKAGARGVRIVLQRAPRMTFRIVDTATAAPIERFGIRLTPIEITGSTRGRYRGDPSIADHANGEIDLPVPGPFAAEVDAPGYAPSKVPVAADAATSNVQTIALVGGSSITGRILVSGKPVPGARVQCVELNTQEKVSLAGKAGANGQSKKGNEYGMSKSAVANDLGEFAIPDLAAGTYALVIEAQGGAEKAVSPLLVSTASELALGDIELAREAVLKGVVRTATGDSPVGFRIALDSGRTTTVTEENGRFEISGLSAGPHRLDWSRGGARFATHRIEFELVSGETSEIVIDATASAPCTLRVRVQKNGLPAANVSVFARSTAENSRGIGHVGRTDAGGNVVGRVEGGVRLLVEAESGAKRLVGASAGPIDTVAGGDLSCEIDMHVGTLTLELPATIAVPETGRVTLWFAKGTKAAVFSKGGPPIGPGETRWSTNRIDFGEVPAGSDELEVRIERYEPGADPENPKGGSWIALREPWKTTVLIEEGQETRVVVP